MRKGLRQVRLCKCGCGRPVKENHSGGRFRGYYRYSAGCDSAKLKFTPEVRKKMSAANKGLRHPAALPLGSRRIVVISGALQYYQIKVSESGRWPYEHRLKMEKKLGRKLKSKEHVHHVNGNSLDNSDDNLVVLSHSEHARITASEHGFGSWDRTKPHKCPCCGIMHDPAKLRGDNAT